jgi:hypothetical protein
MTRPRGRSVECTNDLWFELDHNKQRENGKKGEGEIQSKKRCTLSVSSFPLTPVKTMTSYYLIKEYYDYADDIEGVNIHYLWTPLDGVPDWENQRVTRFMPRVQPPTLPRNKVPIDMTGEAVGPTTLRLRRKILKLPQEVLDPQSGISTDRYLLHHYFEVFQDGHRQYSPLYTEELHTKAATQPATAEAVDENQHTAVASFTHPVEKEAIKSKA